jgi:hypothetical protein
MSRIAEKERESEGRKVNNRSATALDFCFFGFFPIKYFYDRARGNIYAILSSLLPLLCVRHAFCVINAFLQLLGKGDQAVKSCYATQHSSSFLHIQINHRVGHKRP